ncbi:hypothetical protein GCM10009533_02420 [Saccharopolyspora spinosporotrichia]|uniref:Uncharacterized protein n=2 Tax=Saccharopolyspora erythraea TaxID=1836 RepID=A0ABN1BWS9_SACER
MVAAFFAYKAYTKQSGQLKLAQDNALRWHASMFTSWIEWAPEAIDDDTPPELAISRQLHFRYINPSPLPFFQVYAETTLRSLTHNVDIVVSQYFGVLDPVGHAIPAPPATTNTTFSGLKDDACTVEIEDTFPRHLGTEDQIRSWLTSRTEVYFTDSSNVRWCRQGYGRLERIEESEDLRMLAELAVPGNKGGNFKVADGRAIRERIKRQRKQANAWTQQETEEKIHSRRNVQI